MNSKNLKLLFIVSLVTSTHVLPLLTIDNGNPTVDYEKCKLPETNIAKQAVAGAIVGFLLGSVASYITDNTYFRLFFIPYGSAVFGFAEHERRTLSETSGGFDSNALAAKGNIKALEAACVSEFAYKDDANARNAYHYAAAFGQVEALKVLYKNLHCSPNARDIEGKTPANIAAECNQPEAVRLLHALGADFSIHDKLDRSVVDIAQNKPEVKKVIDELRAK